MKRSAVLLIIIAISLTAASQTRSFGIDSFREIQQAFYRDYQGEAHDTTEGGNFNQFRRWERFWGPRLTAHNSFKTAYLLHQKAVRQFNQTETESRNDESNWIELGPKENGLLGVGRVDVIAFHPSDPNTLYVGCPSGGVWVSYDKGQNWQNLNTDQQLPTIGVSSIALDPVNPDIIYLGSGDVDSEWVYATGIYRSKNAGQTWDCIGLCDVDEQYTISKILIHPTDGDVAFVSTSRGIYKTVNRNDEIPEWNKVYPSATGDFEYVRNMAFHPGQPEVLYGVGIDIISSNQSGNVGTWQSIADGNGLDFANTPWPNQFGGAEYVDVMNMAIGPEGDVIYVNCLTRDTPPPYKWDSPLHRYIFKYDINADQWEVLPITNLRTGLTPGRNEMVVSPLDSKYVYIGGVRMYVFMLDVPQQPGEWHLVPFDTHVDFHELVFSPYEPNVLYAGTDGGLYRKEMYSVYPHPEGPTEELNEGLGISTVYNFGSSRIDPYQILCGYQDCGIHYLKNGNWSHIINSDGFQCLMDDTDIDIMHHTTYTPSNGAIRRAINDQSNPSFNYLSIYASAPVNEQSWFGASLVALPANSRTLIQARRNLWKVDNALTATYLDWYKITDVNLLTSAYFGVDNCVSYTLEVAPSDPNYIYFTGVKIDSWAADFDANRIFKTSTGGGTNPGDWTDITPPTPGNSLGTYFVSDIAVSSWSPDKIWICYSGYMEDFKVKHYDGFLWMDYSEGLPNIPANCIIYVNGSNDALFLGTDIGVYYRDGSMPAWEPFMQNLPNVIVNWLELNYTNQMLRAGTFGRGLWETSIPSCSKNGDSAISIHSSVNWIEPQIITNDVSLEPGSTLTILSTVSFAEGCKLIVKANSKLIIDGGKLTNACGDHWEGIEVWGNPSASQHTPLYHGLVQIINGGKIENAVVALRAGSPDFPGKGGGIILANEADFVNNGTCIMFDPYPFTNSSHFSNCNFRRSGNIFSQSDQSLFSLVKLNDVHYVQFENCDFINGTDKDHVGRGIESFNSIFRVLGKCIEYSGDECTEWEHGSFSNLEYGIYATAANASDFAVIKHADFVDNLKGVYLSGMTGALVMDCNFEINTPFVTDGGYALYLDNSTSFTIEENIFAHSGTSRLGMGLVVNNSGGGSNELYRNGFSGLQQGVSAQHVNRSFNSIPPLGLQIRCCKFENCDADILIPRSELTRSGIAPHQGASSLNPADMAGNLFDVHSQVPNDDFDDILNQGTHLNYFYPPSYKVGNEQVVPVDIPRSIITGTPLDNPSMAWNYEMGCPCTETGVGGNFEVMLLTSLAEIQMKINSTEQVLKNLVDGGNTEGLSTEIYNSLPHQTMPLYYKMIGFSPYLSDSAVGAAIDNEHAIPAARLRDIMVANPHTSKSSILLEKLNTRTDTLPGFMMAQILAGRKLISAKEELESKLSIYYLQKSRLMNGLIHYYLNDSIHGAGQQKVIDLLQADEGLASKYRLVMLFVETGNIAVSTELLNLIPVQFSLQGLLLARHQEIVEFCNLTLEVAAQEGGWMQADESQLQQLNKFLLSATPISAWAKNILLALGTLDYVEPVIVPDLSVSVQDEERFSEIMSNHAPRVLEVNPNPANDFVIIGWALNSEQTGCIIVIRNMIGETLHSFSINSTFGSQTIDTKNWQPGLYVLTLYCDGNIIESIKFTT